jgi:hypothetical protein
VAEAGEHVNFIERVMRIMTHVNIGASLGLVAWVLWSCWQMVTGHIAPANRAAEVRALVSLAHAGQPVPMELVPVHAWGGAKALCHEPPPAARRTDMALTGADL